MVKGKNVITADGADTTTLSPIAPLPFQLVSYPRCPIEIPFAPVECSTTSVAGVQLLINQLCWPRLGICRVALVEARGNSWIGNQLNQQWVGQWGGKSSETCANRLSPTLTTNWSLYIRMCVGDTTEEFGTLEAHWCLSR